MNYSGGQQSGQQAGTFVNGSWQPNGQVVNGVWQANTANPGSQQLNSPAPTTFNQNAPMPQETIRQPIDQQLQPPNTNNQLPNTPPQQRQNPGNAPQPVRPDQPHEPQSK